MKWSFTIARIAGTEVRIHGTFVLFLILIAVQAYFTQGGAKPALWTAILFLGVFFCVLLHEFGHAAAALRFGITTPRITLLPIGGVAQMTRIPKEPVKELIIAIAGPLVNVVIAAILIAVQGRFPFFVSVPDAASLSADSMVNLLIIINISLVVFNLIPAFPMDGGRIFRALLAMFTNRTVATVIAVKVGQVIAIGGLILAVGAGQIIPAIIAVFIFFAGKGEEAFVAQESLLEGRTAGEAGMTEFRSVKMNDRLADVLELVLRGDQDSFPVVNLHGNCVAALSFPDILAALQQGGVLVSDAVAVIPRQISAKTSAFEALQALMESGHCGAAVIDEEGKMLRWLTIRQLQEFLAVQTLKMHGLSLPEA